MEQTLFFPDWRARVIFSAGGPQPQVLHEDDKVKVVIVGLEPGGRIPAHAGGAGVPTAAPASTPVPAPAAVSPTPDTAARIGNAMSAAPMAVARDATIIDWPAEEGGPMVVLRQGTNNWTCVTDWPVSPGNDPQCNDPMWTIWSDAYAAGKVPEITTPGIAYMLAGGSDPSNTDPMAMAPAPDEAWITTPSHIMLLVPDGFDAKQFTTDHASGLSYIMWDGTPYEHLMVPVAQTTREEMGDVDDIVANIMASAPLGVALHATIMGNPAKAGDPMVVLRKGDNDWVCNDDRSVSPGNDPSCNDPVWAGDAFNSGKKEEITRPGIAYMLQGGSDESNTDPMATGPAPGEEWIATPAHIMLIVPMPLDTSYFTMDHTSGYPYIMWAGTPFEHLMVPVADMRK